MARVVLSRRAIKVGAVDIRWFGVVLSIVGSNHCSAYM